MTSRWIPGPRARKRLAEMARAGWDWQRLICAGKEFYVTVSTRVDHGTSDCKGSGPGWDKAVADVYRQWKAGNTP